MRVSGLVSWIVKYVLLFAVGTDVVLLLSHTVSCTHTIVSRLLPR